MAVLQCMCFQVVTTTVDAWCLILIAMVFGPRRLRLLFRQASADDKPIYIAAHGSWTSDLSDELSVSHGEFDDIPLYKSSETTTVNKKHH